MADPTTQALDELRQRRQVATLDQRRRSHLAATLCSKAAAMRHSADTARLLAESLLVERRILSEHLEWCGRSHKGPSCMNVTDSNASSDLVARASVPTETPGASTHDHR
jgi:hypothetical protein